MIQFYSPDIRVRGMLPPEESAHCIRVLRKSKGDEIFVVDGKGYRYRCVITEDRAKEISVEILEEEWYGSSQKYKTALAVAPTKNSDRMEWLVEKAVEIGVDRIDFVRCRRSERKDIKTDRLERIAVSAMKQSLKTVKPEISFFDSIDKYVASIEDYESKFIGYCDDTFERKELAKEIKKDTDTVILIGPEGDFTHEEIEKTINNGFLPVTFGEMRLRTETAALYGLSTVHIVNDLGR